MPGTGNRDDLETIVKSLLVQLPTCLDCFYRPIHNIRVFECQDILGDSLIAIRHPFQFGGKTVLIDKDQIENELDREAFRLPEDRFRPLSEDMKHLLGFDTLSSDYQNYRMDYQAVLDNIMPSLRDTEHGYHFCEVLDRTPACGADLMVRIWRREYIGILPPDNPYDWDPYPLDECRREREELWFYWRQLSDLLPTPLSYGDADNSPYHYVPIEEGNYCVNLAWHVDGEVCIRDNIAYLVLRAHGLTDEERRIWPDAQPLPSDQGTGWE